MAQLKLTDPGMPPLGQAWYYMTVGQFPEVEIPKGRSKHKATFQQLADEVTALRLNYIEMLHGEALYNARFPMNVSHNGAQYTFCNVPGHRWGETETYGPLAPCKVVIIGKCPGKDEETQRRNFVGPSGVLLYEKLREVGFSPEEIQDFYVTNLVRWPQLEAGGTLPKAWVKDCRTLLEFELRILQPDYILCLGSEAGKELLGSLGGVTDMTGRVDQYPIPVLQEDGTFKTKQASICVVTHPAAVLRNPDSTQQLIDGLVTFRQMLGGGMAVKRWENVDHRLIYNLDDLNKTIDEILASPENDVLSVDCEWGCGELRTIQFSHKPYFGATVVLRSTGARVVFQPGPEAAYEALKRLFKSTPDRKVRIGGAFFRSDIKELLKVGIDVSEEYEPAEDFADVRTRGGWAIELMAHAINETDLYGLDTMACRYSDSPNYWTDLLRWVSEAKLDLKKVGDTLDGYGTVPDEILLGVPGQYYSYTNYDCDIPMRIFRNMTKKDGLLDRDVNGKSLWESYWRLHRGSAAALEIEINGMRVDMARATELQVQFRKLYDDKLVQFKEDIGWPDCPDDVKTNRWDNFKPTSSAMCREILYGVEFNRKKDGKRISPPETLCAGLTPIKTTGKRGKEWGKIVAKREEKKHTPSTDGETLGILSVESEIAKGLLDLRTIQTVLSRTLCDPTIDDTEQRKEESEEATAAVVSEIILGKDSEDVEYDKGLLSYVTKDGFIHTNIRQVLETARWASRNPNLQNLPNAMQAKYDQIYKKVYGTTMMPIRSIFQAREGHLIVEADYTGAELAIIAWESGDPLMIEHVRRNMLPEDHPEYFDIHSNMAVEAFGLQCEPTKSALKAAGLAHLRIAAKAVIFGANYGRQPEALLREAKDAGAKDVTIETMRKLLKAYFDRYPLVYVYIMACSQRVHSPGWLVNYANRYRRFATTTDQQAASEMERQAMNWKIQSGVADAMIDALWNLRAIRKALNLKFKLILQVHDALMLDVPYNEVEVVMDYVLPTAMETCVSIWPRDFDGRPIRTITQPYHLSAHREVNTRWGEVPTKEFCRSVGVPERFGKDPKPTAA